MTLLLFEGFERRAVPPVYIGDSVAQVATYGANGSSWPAGRFGGYAQRLDSFASVNPSRIEINLPSLTGFAFGIALSPVTGQALGMWNTDVRFLKIGETPANLAHLCLRFNAASKVELIRGDGTILATSSSVIPKVGWNHYAVECVIGDGTAGSAKVWINSTLEINVTGVDTRNGGTGVVTMVAIGSLIGTGVMTGNSGGDSVQMYDDLWVCDLTGPAPYNASLGDCVVETILPTAQGTHNAWVGNDTNSVDNWALIDEQPANITDYIASGTSGAKDTSAMMDIAVTGQPVYALRTEIQVWTSDGGVLPVDLKDLLRDTTGNEVSAVVATPPQVTSGAQWAKGPIRTTDVTGGALDEADVNTLQVGVALA